MSGAISPIFGPLTVYRDDAVFRALRAPDGFHGRCGACVFKVLCGGSHARAWAATGDVLGEDPLCLRPGGKARHHGAARRSTASKHCVVSPCQSGRLLDTP